MIHSILRDQDWSFCCQVNGNIKLSKFFDEMRLFRSLRLLRSLRPLRSLRLLRLLRFKMLRKSLNMNSASCHFPQKGINEPKTLKKKLKTSLHQVHSNSFLQKKFHTLSLGGCGGQGCYFQPNPRVISQMSASHKCADTVFMT